MRISNKSLIGLEWQRNGIHWSQRRNCCLRSKLLCITHKEWFKGCDVAILFGYLASIMKLEGLLEWQAFTCVLGVRRLTVKSSTQASFCMTHAHLKTEIEMKHISVKLISFSVIRFNKKLCIWEKFLGNILFYEIVIVRCNFVVAKLPKLTVISLQKSGYQR